MILKSWHFLKVAHHYHSKQEKTSFYQSEKELCVYHNTIFFSLILEKSTQEKFITTFHFQKQYAYLPQLYNRSLLLASDRAPPLFL